MSVEVWSQNISPPKRGEGVWRPKAEFGRGFHAKIAGGFSQSTNKVLSSLMFLSTWVRQISFNLSYTPFIQEDNEYILLPHKIESHTAKTGLLAEHRRLRRYPLKKFLYKILLIPVSNMRSPVVLLENIFLT